MVVLYRLIVVLLIAVNRVDESVQNILPVVGAASHGGAELLYDAVSLYQY